MPPLEATTPHDPPKLSVYALDDDDDFRQFLRATLEADGHRVRTMAEPTELFAACEERLPDVVLLDMKMGPHSGEEVLAKIRARWSKLCVVVVTGYPTMEGMRQTFKREAYDYLAKPFSVQELRRVLSQAAAELGLGKRPQDRLRDELGRRIRLARSQRGWTLKELGEASGVSVSQLSSIERGTHLPSVESLLDIAGALGAKASEWIAAAGE